VNVRTTIVFCQPTRALSDTHTGRDPRINRKGEPTMPKYLITYHGGEGMPATPEPRSK